MIREVNLVSIATTSPNRRWSALALIVTAQFMVILDVAIVNVALPSIKSDLGFSQTNLQWVISAYAILFGGVLLLGGRLADLLGRRRLFVGGLALFAVSSLLCGLAWSESSLIAFRAVQGLGGALLAPAALSLLMTTFEEGRERNLALGIYGAASGSGAAVGVLLGGLLTSYLSWSWIFFINVPVGVAAIALAPVLLRESRAELAHRHFDVPGATSITAGLMLLVYATTRATTDGWGSGSTLALLGASAPALPRLPLGGHYFWDLFPWFVLGGAGMGLSFVPVTIASLTGVERSDAGVASGLINTSRQIGGAIGIAAISAVAASSTSHYVTAHSAVTATSGIALDHGFQTALYVLTGLLVLGALITVSLLRPAPAPSAEAAPVDEEMRPLEEAA